MIHPHGTLASTVSKFSNTRPMLYPTCRLIHFQSIVRKQKGNHRKMKE